jgi:GT2 family glycosyltransferase
VITQTAMIVTVAGRHGHLRRQQQGILDGSVLPDHQVIVSMGDTRVGRVLANPQAAKSSATQRPTVIDLPTTGDLPLAAARNLGASHAIDAGVDLLIFLDVDCIPGPHLVERYRHVATNADRGGSGSPTLWGGPVAYLPPAADGYPRNQLTRLARPHPSRPVPREHECRPEPDFNLFWSLSFAVTATDWTTLGGFCEDYVGYGAEDTDLAQRAASLGGSLIWVGGAWAYHQHHHTTHANSLHTAAIVRNANLFHDRWGWFPMTDWLDDLARTGHVYYHPAERKWRAARPRTS